MTALLEVSNLVQSFFGVRALNGVELAVERGTITGIIGPNGAGKSTLFNVLCGLFRPDAGKITFDRQEITAWRPELVTSAGMVRSFQIARGFPSLSVMENLLVYGPRQPGELLLAPFLRLAQVRSRERELERKAYMIAERLRLTGVLNQRASDISGGQKKLLEIGRALMTDPKLILLDEPLAGVNPALGNEIADDILDINRQSGLTFVIVEHDMGMVAKLCEPVIVMAEGRVLATGTFEEIVADPAVQEAYMGVAA
jgi:branched-chain amino acid transport system ATP-binding protein/neutral amino acid transport system ATP-binding protein